MSKVLLIEDDKTFSRILEGFLGKNKFTVDTAQDGKTGLKKFQEGHWDLVLLDYRLPDVNGLELLAELKKTSPSLPVIIMTSFSDIRTAVKAIKSGAFEYITKPVNPDELLLVMKNALEKGKESNGQGSPTREKRPEFVTGKSPGSQKLNEYIKLVAPTDMSVIIEGESGTGKEYVANSIHHLSKRAKKPF